VITQDPYDPGPVIERLNHEQPGVPLRRCVDCEHDLGDALRALRCPLYGKRRSLARSQGDSVEVRCIVFQPLPAREGRDLHAAQTRHDVRDKIGSGRYP
jgi:hypothetical protein